MRKSKHHEYRQAYNAQAVVDAGGSQLIVSARISQCASDRNDLVADIEAIPAVLGRPETVLADNGYANGAAVAALEASGIEALVSTAAEGRLRTHDFRPAKAHPPAREPKAEWLKAMAEKLASEEGPCPLQASPPDRRAGLRRHQGGARLRRVLAARPRKGRGRVDLGGSRLQLQALAQAEPGGVRRLGGACRDRGRAPTPRSSAQPAKGLYRQENQHRNRPDGNTTGDKTIHSR